MATIDGSTLIPIGKALGILTLAVGATWWVADFSSKIEAVSVQLQTTNEELREIKVALTLDFVTRIELETYISILRMANPGRDITFPDMPKALTRR